MLVDTPHPWQPSADACTANVSGLHDSGLHQGFSGPIFMWGLYSCSVTSLQGDSGEAGT